MSKYFSIRWGKRLWTEGAIFPEIDMIRKAAKKDGWVGFAGFDGYVEETYNGKIIMNTDKDIIIGVRFRNEAGMQKFKDDQVKFMMGVE